MPEKVPSGSHFFSSSTALRVFLCLFLAMLVALPYSPVAATSSNSMMPSSREAASPALATAPEQYFLYIGEHPRDAETAWADNVQGVTHDGTHWFITQEKTLWRVPVSLDLKTVTRASPGVSVVDLDDISQLVDQGYNHFGDPVFYGGYVFVPIEGGDPGPGIAVFEGEGLRYVGDAPTGLNRAAWVAADPMGRLYTSGNPIDGALHRFTVDWEALRERGVLQFVASTTVPLLDESGNPVQIDTPQGGVISPGGQVLYLVAGYGRGEDPSWGIHVFDLSTGRRVQRSSNGTGPFNYEFHPSDIVAEEEPEGITIWDLEDGRAPGFRGQLHVLMLDNDRPDSDDVYFKHYTCLDAYPVLFEHTNYGGRPLPIPNTVADLTGLDFNDKASSIWVPPGWTVTVFEHTGFGGDSLVITRSISDLHERGWGDRLSSVQVSAPSLNAGWPGTYTGWLDGRRARLIIQQGQSPGALRITLQDLERGITLAGESRKPACDGANYVIENVTLSGGDGQTQTIKRLFLHTWDTRYISGYTEWEGQNFGLAFGTEGLDSSLGRGHPLSADPAAWPQQWTGTYEGRIDGRQARLHIGSPRTVPNGYAYEVQVTDLDRGVSFRGQGTVMAFEKHVMTFAAPLTSADGEEKRLVKLFLHSWDTNYISGYDLWGGRHFGNLFVRVASGSSPQAGGSLRLDGDGDYVEIPFANDLNNLRAITIEAWVKRDASRCETVVGNGWRESYWLGFCSGPIRFYHTGYQRVDGIANILPGQWTHIAVTYDGVTRRYYVNGRLDRETTENNGPITPGSGALYIGGDRHGGYYFKGLIDEVRIWNAVRTQAEIRADMYRAINEPRPGLLAVWHFDGDAQDAVGTHHGILRSNASFSSEGFPRHVTYLPLIRG